MITNSREAALMNTPPSASAVQPARAAPCGSPAPTRLPTRTAPADAMPSGTMKAVEAILSAIWCEALDTGSSLPASAVASAKAMTSIEICSAAGNPNCHSRASRRREMCLDTGLETAVAHAVVVADGQPQHQQHVEAGGHGGPRGAGHAERGHAEPAVDEQLVGGGVDQIGGDQRERHRAPRRGCPAGSGAAPRRAAAAACSRR